MIKNIGNKFSCPSSFYTKSTFLRTLVIESYFHDPKIALSKFPCLRSLNLGFCSIKEVPIEIRKCIHLRYLNLSCNFDLEELPEALCELCNLQTLDITACMNLKKLPHGLGNLINLRHFLNWRVFKITYMPKSLQRLTGLLSLGEFYISKDRFNRKTCSVECLKNFKHLRKIAITGLGNLRGVDKVKGIELNNKKNLRELGLGFFETMNEDHEELLETLQPHPNLESLWLRDYRGNNMFPNWMMSLTNLRKLLLGECIKCEHLPPLGKLSSLEILQIEDMNDVVRVGIEFLGIESEVALSSSSVIAFPKLKFLSFTMMKKWEEWDFEITNRGGEDIIVMPSLKTLQLLVCPKLKSLPNHLCQMTTLKVEIDGCPLLVQQRTHS
ncbi:putative disease resistance protein At3g14460 [Pistacia vera]|uniref:putative disease resistance protein At3g14460 n=1 Tax=Pistacia vera TaxID=55513 RepID=UPI0012635324|nr:putative disease resistance protein At3g14460 [Pistacia vera]XP_031251817.1 putative disease resistance protein At3g14460 [Pistacia vera]XP_031251818.1 putative disease resistance protein At3g14460 [Pistacia vera]XP_031251819.1 putative disease resistance protein At3g14460 [Pistacia vera]